MYESYFFFKRDKIFKTRIKDSTSVLDQINQPPYALINTKRSWCCLFNITSQERIGRLVQMTIWLKKYTPPSFEPLFNPSLNVKQRTIKGLNCKEKSLGSKMKR
jgi:hypothetical protein